MADEARACAGDYDALVHFLASECRKNGVTIRLGSAVTAIEASEGGGVVLYTNGDANESRCRNPHGAYSSPERGSCCLRRNAEKAALAVNIGFGNIIKVLLRFETRWWLRKPETI